VGYLDKPLNFLRPYTPEAIGWLSNWNSLLSSYDSNGKYARIYVQGGPSTLTPNPGIVPPGTSENPYPLPGQNGGTPWTDAYGSGIR
jgi:phospholipid/cholesterol/gamma-HCH transport system substrate-binding protein